MEDPHQINPLISFRLENVTPLSGHFYGLRQRTLSLKASAATDLQLTQFMSEFSERLRETLNCRGITKEPKLEDHGESYNLNVISFLELVAALQEAGGGVVVEKPLIFHDYKSEHHDYSILLPTINPNICSIATKGLYNILLQATEYKTLEIGKYLEKMAMALVNDILKVTPQATNPRHFIRAAYKLDIPHMFLTRDIIQFGYGHGSRLFNSSLTDETPAIGTSLVKNKQISSNIMKRAGFPVPKQIGVSSVESAVNAAKKIGYPVVLKPSDQDMGRGVFSRIKTEGQLRSYFPKTFAISKNIIVEKHEEGENYRVNVVKGKVVRAREQLGARVIGDGRSTIYQLIQRENQDSRRGVGRFYDLSPIIINNDLNEVLAAQHMSVNDIPKVGQRVWLAHHTNASQGGISLDRTNEIHPDNSDLCVRATQLFGLDISGIDIIIKDISKSYLDIGGAICEVNAQPQIMRNEPFIHEDILQGYVSSQPVIKISVLQRGAIGNYRNIDEQLLDRNNKMIHLKAAVDVLLKLGLPVSYYNNIEFDAQVPHEDRDEIQRVFGALHKNITYPKSI